MQFDHCPRTYTAAEEFRLMASDCVAFKLALVVNDAAGLLLSYDEF